MALLLVAWVLRRWRASYFYLGYDLIARSTWHFYFAVLAWSNALCVCHCSAVGGLGHVLLVRWGYLGYDHATR